VGQWYRAPRPGRGFRDGVYHRRMPVTARYDGLADWYDAHLGDFTKSASALLLELIGPGPGRCLEIGCGGGIHLPALAEAGWSVVGVDVSSDQLRVARRRMPAAELILADATALPLPDRSFEAVVAAFVETDVDDFKAVVREAARVLRPSGRFACVGTHPCFTGPFARLEEDGTRRIFPGYRDAGWADDGPGLAEEGLRRKVGVRHVPLAELLSAPLAAGLTLDRIEEPGDEPIPMRIAFAATKGTRR
jgi:SAM-dependent methyltransferase